MGTAGALSLQQLPYECPDPSFEYTTESDILRPVVGTLASDFRKIDCDELIETVNSYEQSLKTESKKKRQGDQVGRPTYVSSHDDVRPLRTEPDSAERPKSELELLLESQHIQDPYPYPGNTDHPFSYSSESPDSALSINLRAQVKHTLAHIWKHDPIRCSVKAAIQADRDLAANPNHGFTNEEYIWASIGRLPTVKTARIAAEIDFEQAKKNNESIRNLDVNGEIDSTNLNQELDEFYGKDGIDLRPVENDSDDEGFHEPGANTRTAVSLHGRSHMEPGVTPGGIIQDSGIAMDEGYAQYALANSHPNTAKDLTGIGPSDWPTFDAEIAPLRLPKMTGPWLGLVGDQKACEWPGRRQGPYDLVGLHDDAEVLGEPMPSVSDPQDTAGSFTPQPVPRKTSVDQNFEAIGAQLTAALGVAEVPDAEKVVDSPTVDTTYKTPLPPATRSIESLERAQEASAPLEGKVDDKPSEATPQFFGQGQPHPIHGKHKSGKNIETQENIHEVPTSSRESGKNKSSEVVPRLVSEERPQHLENSNESTRNDGPSTVTSDEIRAIPQSNIDIDAHPHRNIPTTAFSTPVNQRIRPIQQVQIDTPVTPATVNINPTPEQNSDMDVDNVSNSSLDSQLPDSPTAKTQKGQSALGHYVQETTSHPNRARKTSSTSSLDGSESEEVSLIPTPDRPSQPEGLAGFSKAVELHQKKNDAVFTLSTPKASQNTPSSSKTAQIPSTPVNRNDSASFRPTTPFQLGTPAHPHIDSPGTPTPAPKGDGKSVKSIFSSPKLGSRSPERAEPSFDIVVAPATPVAGVAGGQGLLFQKAKTNEKDTKNVLNSLTLSSERGNESSLPEDLDDYEDELAGEKTVGVYKGGRRVQETRGIKRSGVDPGAKGGRRLASAVVVPSVRPRDESEGTQSEEPPKKKQRRSVRARGGPDVSDVGPVFER